jgi:hypothetical protein
VGLWVLAKTRKSGIQLCIKKSFPASEREMKKAEICRVAAKGEADEETQEVTRAQEVWIGTIQNFKETLQKEEPCPKSPLVDLGSRDPEWTLEQ